MDDHAIADALLEPLDIHPSAYSPALRPLLEYFVKHGVVDVLTSDRTEVLDVLKASPELHRVRTWVAEGLDQLRDGGFLSSAEELIQFGTQQQLVRWGISIPDELHQRLAPDVMHEFEDRARRWANARPFVKHDGIAKVGGEQDFATALSRLPEGGTIRWFTYHTLATGGIRALEARARRPGANFRVMILLMRERPRHGLIEGAIPDSHRDSVRAGLRDIAELKHKLADLKEVRIETRQFGRKPWEARLRAIVVTDGNDVPIRTSMVTFMIPGGRGTEGERLVCDGSELGIVSLAYLAREYFDAVWRSSHPIRENLRWLLVLLGGAVALGLSPFPSLRATMIGVLIGLVPSIAVAWPIRHRRKPT
jgi:hypothetical protein